MKPGAHGLHELVDACVDKNQIMVWEQKRADEIKIETKQARSKVTLSKVLWNGPQCPAVGMHAPKCGCWLNLGKLGRWWL